MSSRIRYGVALIALSSVLFALMAVLARSLTGKASVGQLVLARCVVGLLTLLPLYLARGEWPRSPRPLIWSLRGLFGGGAVLLYFAAIARLGVGPATLLNYTAPIVAGTLGSLLLGEPLTFAVLIGLVASTCGAALVSWSMASAPHVTDWEIGVLAGVGAALMSGAAMAVVKTLRRDHDTSMVFLSFNLFGLLWAVPAALLSWSPLTLEVLVGLIGVGVLSVGAQMLFTYAFAYTPTAIGSATTQLVPAISWTLGLVVLEEPFRPLALLGAAITVGGVLFGSTGLHFSSSRAKG